MSKYSPIVPNVSNILQFHTATMESQPTIFSDEAYKFGTLDLSLSHMDPIPYTWDVKFSIDNSASMSDKCQDGRTKMQHIKHTLSNIIRLFASYKDERCDEISRFNISISTFNHEVRHILGFSRITDADMDEIIEKINGIYEEGSTDLVNPIKQAHDQIIIQHYKFPENKKLHFLLTDGIDSCGNSSQKIIEVATKFATDPAAGDCETVVLGFGIDHDTKTLTAIGELPRCSYGFIAEIEKAGIVYGEVIYNIVHRSITDLVFESDNAELYCWKTNSWSGELQIGNLPCNTQKTYYVRTKEPTNDVKIDICWKTCAEDNMKIRTVWADIYALPDLLDENNVYVPVDLFDHVYRYKTLELLHKANNTEVSTRSGSFMFCDDGVEHSSSKRQISDIKKQLLDLYVEMRNYTKTKYPDGSQFMDGLLDDIYICRVSFDNKRARIYSTTRQRTQGDQNVYTPTSISLHILNKPRDYNTNHLGTIFTNSRDLNLDDILNNTQTILQPDLSNDDSQDPFPYLDRCIDIPPLLLPLEDPNPENKMARFDIRELEKETLFYSHSISQNVQNVYSNSTVDDIIRTTTSDTADNV
jgi:hypothetical protein